MNDNWMVRTVEWDFDEETGEWTRVEKVTNGRVVTGEWWRDDQGEWSGWNTVNSWSRDEEGNWTENAG